MVAVAATVIGPWSITERTGHAETEDTPKLKFLKPSEYRYINRTAREIIPDEPVLKGVVDVAGNIGRLSGKERRCSFKRNGR